MQPGTAYTAVPVVTILLLYYFTEINRILWYYSGWCAGISNRSYQNTTLIPEAVILFILFIRIYHFTELNVILLPKRPAFSQEHPDQKSRAGK